MRDFRDKLRTCLGSHAKNAADRNFSNFALFAAAVFTLVTFQALRYSDANNAARIMHV